MVFKNASVAVMELTPTPAQSKLSDVDLTPALSNCMSDEVECLLMGPPNQKKVTISKNKIVLNQDIHHTAEVREPEASEKGYDLAAVNETKIQPADGAEKKTEKKATKDIEVGAAERSEEGRLGPESSTEDLEQRGRMSSTGDVEKPVQDQMPQQVQMAQQILELFASSVFDDQNDRAEAVRKLREAARTILLCAGAPSKTRNEAEANDSPPIDDEEADDDVKDQVGPSDTFNLQENEGTAGAYLCGEWSPKKGNVVGCRRHRKQPPPSDPEKNEVRNLHEEERTVLVCTGAPSKIKNEAEANDSKPIDDEEADDDKDDDVNEQVGASDTFNLQENEGTAGAYLCGDWSPKKGNVRKETPPSDPEINEGMGSDPNTGKSADKVPSDAKKNEDVTSDPNTGKSAVEVGYTFSASQASQISLILLQTMQFFRYGHGKDTDIKTSDARDEPATETDIKTDVLSIEDVVSIVSLLQTAGVATAGNETVEETRNVNPETSCNVPAEEEREGIDGTTDGITTGAEKGVRESSTMDAGCFNPANPGGCFNPTNEDVRSYLYRAVFGHWSPTQGNQVGAPKPTRAIETITTVQIPGEPKETISNLGSFDALNFVDFKNKGEVRSTQSKKEKKDHTAKNTNIEVLASRSRSTGGEPTRGKFMKRGWTRIRNVTPTRAREGDEAAKASEPKDKPEEKLNNPNNTNKSKWMLLKLLGLKHSNSKAIEASGQRVPKAKSSPKTKEAKKSPKTFENSVLKQVNAPTVKTTDFKTKEADAPTEKMIEIETKKADVPTDNNTSSDKTKKADTVPFETSPTEPTKAVAEQSKEAAAPTETTVASRPQESKAVDAANDKRKKADKSNKAANKSKWGLLKMLGLEHSDADENKASKKASKKVSRAKSSKTKDAKLSPKANDKSPQEPKQVNAPTENTTEIKTKKADAPTENIIDNYETRKARC